MAWAATTTFTTGQVVTAAQMNVISGDLDALNTRISSNTVATSETRANGAYGDLTTSGPAVTITTGTFALVMLGAKMSNNTANGSALMSVTVSGATSITASDTFAAGFVFTSTSGTTWFGRTVLVGALTAGSNTFTAKYRSGGGDTATFVDRNIIVIPQF